MTTIKKGVAGSQDLYLWDGTTTGKTFTRESSAGYDMTLNAVGGSVDVLMVYGGGVNYTLAAIVAAKAAIGAVNKVALVFRPGAWTITDDLTITANLTMVVLPGASFTITAGKTLTVNGPIIAGPYQIFGATGTATVSTYPQDQAWWGSTQRLDVTGILVSGLTASSTVRTSATKVLTSFADGLYYPEAYGAAGDGTTDDTTAIQDCITAAPAGSIIHLSGKTYKITDTLTCDKALTFQGTGYTTQIKQVTASKGGIAITGSSVNVYDIFFNGVGHAVFDTAEMALNIYGASYAAAISKVRVEHCFFTNWGDGAINAQYLTDFTFNDNQIDGVHYYGIQTLSCVDGDISGNRIDDVPGSAGTSLNAYGIAITRNSVDSLATDPRSANITILRNVISNIPTWHGINTHAGKNLTISGNVCLNTDIGICVVGCPKTDGSIAYAPLGVAVVGNVVDSQQTDGSRGLGIQLNGAYAAAATVEYATDCSIVGNVVVGHGDEDATDAFSAGIKVYSTYGLTLCGNTLRWCACNGIILDLDNFAPVVTGNACIDIWSATAAVCGVRVYNDYNSSFIISDLTATNKSSSATYRLNTADGIAVLVSNNANNAGKLGLVNGNATGILTDAGSKISKNLN